MRHHILFCGGWSSTKTMGTIRIPTRGSCKATVVYGMHQENYHHPHNKSTRG